MAEHSFCTRFCWCNSARAQGLQKPNMPSIERSFYLLNIRTICAIFLYNSLNPQGPYGYHYLSLVFKQHRCHGNSTHLSQNAKTNPSVVNLDSCKKRAPKHKQFKSNGELGTWKLCSATLNKGNHDRDGVWISDLNHNNYNFLKCDWCTNCCILL